MNKENKNHRAAVLRGMQALLVSAAVLCTCGCKDWEGLVNNEKPFTIHSIVPSQLMANDTVTIKGIGFDDAVKVLFNQTEGTIVSKSADAIKVVLPEMTNGSDALTEKIAVRVYSPTQYREKPYEMQFPNAIFTLENLKYKVDTLAHYPVGPGSYYTEIALSHEEFPLKVHFLTMNVRAEHLLFRPVLADDQLGNAERVVHMGPRKTAQGHGRYFAGVNGDFFNLGGDNRILDGMTLDGNVVALPTETGVGNMIVQKDGAVFIDELSYSKPQITIGGTVTPLDNINNKRANDQIVLYNHFYGATTQTDDTGTEVVVKPTEGAWALNANVAFEVVETHTAKGNTAIPEGCAVLSATGTKQAVLNALHAGDKGTFNIALAAASYNLSAPIHTLGVKPLILKDGKPTSYVWNERHPRTSLGLSADRSTLYMCVVDGRWSNVSVGVTTTQLALLMKRAGAATAFNLDGGGSSTMYAYNTGLDGTGLMNRPNGGTYTRKVANAFFAVADVKDDNRIAAIASAGYVIRVKQGESAALRFYGINAAGLIVDNDLKDVQLAVSPALGTIEGQTFKATGKQRYGTITATRQGVSTQIRVYVE